MNIPNVNHSFTDRAGARWRVGVVSSGLDSSGVYGTTVELHRVRADGWPLETIEVSLAEYHRRIAK